MGARALLIGLDSLDPRTFDAMMTEGEMPAAAALARASARARIENYEGLGAGAFWPSAATGVPPGDHGRCFRLQFDSQTYEVSFRDDGKDFPVDAFWHRLDKDGLKTAIIDWPHGPFRPTRHGFILNNWLAHDPSSAFKSFPATLAKEVAQRHGVDPWEGGAFRYVPKSAEEWRGFIAAGVDRIERKTRYCLERLGEDWDLFAPIFHEPHDFGHYGLHLADKTHFAHDAELAREVGDPLRAICAALDKAIAALVAAAGPRATVMVVGGPGMAPLVSGTPMMEQLARRLDTGAGAKALTEEWAQKTYRSALPLPLRRLLSPLTRRVLRRTPQLPEWAARRFFAVPHTHNSGCLRINLKGREKFGVVEQAHYEPLLEQLTRDLLEITNADTGEPVVEKVVLTHRTHRGALSSELPDLFAVWRRNKPFPRVTSPKIGLIENEPMIRTGDHTAHGFFWAPRRSRLEDGATLAPHETVAIVAAAARERREAKAETTSA